MRALFAGTYTQRVVSVFLDLFVQLLPFVAAGILLVALLKLLVPRDKVAARLSKRRVLPLIFASLIGAISPIGTYALIPLIASLLKERTFPRAPLVAFLIASPLINPLLFLMTYGAFGPVMAFLRLLAALVLGVSGGLIAGLVWKPVKSTSEPRPIEMLSSQAPITFRRFLSETVKEGKFILRIFSFSLLVAALTSALVPKDLVLRIMGGNSLAAVFIAVLAGIPLYACGGGAIPVLEVLQQMGMSKGAILAFFISGPATKFSTLAAVFACLERKVIALYLGVTLVGAFLFGVLYNLF